MTITMTSNMRSTAVAALLTLPLAAGSAFAQQAQSTDQSQQPTASSEAGSGQESAQAETAVSRHGSPR